MKIIVTGGAGFIGSTIVDRYVEAGHKVWAIDNLSSGRRRLVNKKATLVKVDICDKAKLSRVFAKIKPDVVSHHAAQIDVRKSVEDPAFDAKVNIIGILNVLDLCRQNKVKKFIFSSSGGTVYGECPRPADEQAPEVPLSPYGVAKLASEKYILAYASLYGLTYTIFRYSNVYGPRQNPHGEAGVISIFSTRLLNNQPIVIFGDGKQTRDFVYVGDVARANLMALRKAHNQIINIGNCQSTSVVQLYGKMAGILGINKPAPHKPPRNGELQRSLLDIKKAARVLGWKPLTNIDQGLKETISYFRQDEGK